MTCAQLYPCIGYSLQFLIWIAVPCDIPVFEESSLKVVLELGVGSSPSSWVLAEVKDVVVHHHLLPGCERDRFVLRSVLDDPLLNEQPCSWMTQPCELLETDGQYCQCRWLTANPQDNLCYFIGRDLCGCL